MDAAAWDEALAAYYDEYEDVGIGPTARAAELFQVDTDPDDATLGALPEGVDPTKDITLVVTSGDLLDEIDGLLESNAEEFVRSYVQKGGE